MKERLDVFMARANAAYYASRDPFADFTTAPEISQVFGELIGAWAASAWVAMGAPSHFLFVEAGPGRGTLMADALRLAGQVAPAFRQALQVHFVEISERLCSEQARRVPGAVWHARLEDVPAGPAIVIANEFLDALPIRQFVRRGGNWMERFVENERFLETSAGGLPEDAREGTVLDHGEAALAWTSTLARRLVAQGGAALLIDYGPAENRPQDSLQAVRDGAPADPLSRPGSVDLTAHVHFASVREAALAEGAAVWGPVPQGVFLNRLGLPVRIQQLAQANPSAATKLYEAADRLTAPGRMGQLFKALALTAPGTPVPAGFEE